MKIVFEEKHLEDIAYIEERYSAAAKKQKIGLVRETLKKYEAGLEQLVALGITPEYISRILYKCGKLDNAVADLVSKDSIAAFEKMLSPRGQDAPPLFTPKNLSGILWGTRSKAGVTVQTLANECLPAFEMLIEKLGKTSHVTGILHSTANKTPETLNRLTSPECLTAFDAMLEVLEPRNLSNALNNTRHHAPDALMALAANKERLKALEEKGVVLSSFCEWLHFQSKKDFSTILDKKLTQLEAEVENGTYVPASLKLQVSAQSPAALGKTTPSMFERAWY